MKAYRLIIILLIVIIAFPIAGRIFWLMKKSRPINIVIINKTVQESSQNEVKTLCWTLNFQKFVKKDGDYYDFNQDYHGYFPNAVSFDKKIKSFKLEEISSVSEKNDALFFIDNFGVKINQNNKKSPKLTNYGGLNQIDYYLLREMINRKKLVVAEYNFFSSPTEDLVRYNTEHFLDIYSLGWVGKYFSDLSEAKILEEISANWLEIYKQIYSANWEFKGPGIILLNSRENRILVIPATKYMNSEFPSIITLPDIAKAHDIPQKISYTGWFEFDYQGKNNVLCNFELNLNQDGIDLLMKNGIEHEFPAVIESVNKKFYYIAGDFSKVTVCTPLSRLGFFSKLLIAISRSSMENPDKFFNLYYNNLLSSILNDYYKDISLRNN